MLQCILKEEFPAVSRLDADFSKSDSDIDVFAMKSMLSLVSMIS